MNEKQSTKYITKLLKNFFLSQLFLSVEGANVKYEKVLPRKIHASLTYFHLEGGKKETSDRRELQLIATNIRGHLEILFREIKTGFVYDFPNYDHGYLYLRSGQLEELLLEFLKGNPVNDEVETKFRIDDIEFTKIYDLTKEVIDLEYNSRVI